MANLTSGSSATKIHWQNAKIHGSRTACKLKISYAANDNKDFEWWVNKNPEVCCKKCLIRYNEKFNKQ